MHNGKPFRIAIIASHPIQYHAHWFRSLAAHEALDVTVFFGHRATASDQERAGFATPFEWDIPLLEGYSYQFLRNAALKARNTSFWGIVTPDISSVIHRKRFDAVILLGWRYASDWQAILACWRTGTPVLVRGDSNLLTQRSRPKRWLKRVLHGSFIPRFEACLAVGTRSQYYFRYYGARRVFRVPHSIDHRLFRLAPCIDDRERARESLGLPMDRTIFLFAGKFVDQKRPLDFVDGLAVASSRGAPVHGLMVGDGPLRGSIEKRIRDTNAPVRIAGFKNQSEMLGAYYAADALVLPSDGRETWGLVVNEAMASGVPCIVSDHVGCSPDLVLPGETGDIFPLGRVDTLASLMMRYASDRSKLYGMGRTASCHEARYSEIASVEGMISALQAVLRE